MRDTRAKLDVKVLAAVEREDLRRHLGRKQRAADQRLLARPPGLEPTGEVAARPQLGDR